MRRVLFAPLLRTSQAGFTLVELLVVMGILAVTTGMVTVSLVRPQTSAASTSIVNELVTDLKNQQFKAMMGDSGTATSAQAHGVYIQSNQYTLFKGSSYSSVDADNGVVATKSGTSLSTTLPSGQVVFAKGTGEVSGFVNGSNTINITNTATGGVTQIVINRLGVVTVN